MYKKQLVFQRIVCMLMLFASGIVFVYSLGLMTDLYDSLYSTMMNPDDYLETTVEGSIIYYDMQQFNHNLTYVAIGLIFVTLILFITNTHSRRKYYIGNYIAIGLSVVCNVAASVWALLEVFAYKAQYQQIDFEQLKFHSELWNTYYTESTFWFDVSVVVFGILLIVTVLLFVNLILKLIMMKEEKRLIGSRKDVRA